MLNIFLSEAEMQATASKCRWTNICQIGKAWNKNLSPQQETNQNQCTVVIKSYWEKSWAHIRTKKQVNWDTHPFRQMGSPTAFTSKIEEGLGNEGE